MKKIVFKIKWFLYNQINKQNPFIALLLDNLDIFDDITKIIEFCGVLLLSAIVLQMFTDIFLVVVFETAETTGVKQD